VYTGQTNSSIAMNVIADLQIHSKYARAVSPDMVVSRIWDWAKLKGIGVVATGDWTHPLWMREIKSTLTEMGNGLLRLTSKDEFRDGTNGPYFLLETEVSCIYAQGGKLRRIHTLIWSPSIASAEKINQELTVRGAKLMSDGRPIIGLTSIQVAEIVLSVDSTCLVIPAHAWTPWFSLYGSQSGFDSIDECFGQYAKYIYAIETGLSSDPAMNWRIKELDTRSVVSFSDAHSGPKLAREATVFNLTELSYGAIREAIMAPSKSGQNSVISDQQPVADNRSPKTDNHITYTIEFHPEEGKYHYTGHRNCGIKHSPGETKEKGMICPVCGKKLTIGVMHRVEQLAGRSEKDLQLSIVRGRVSEGGADITMTKSLAFPERPSYVMLVPLQEILAEAIGGLPTGKPVQNEYKKLVDRFGSEFTVLLNCPIDNITQVSGSRVGEALDKVRRGDIVIDPGYDGVFGVVKIWGDKKKMEISQGVPPKDQLSLF
jgi:PHP family Zn ribbon phosphoesterase